jgi:hypothetical protein
MQKKKKDLKQFTIEISNINTLGFLLHYHWNFPLSDFFKFFFFLLELKPATQLITLHLCNIFYKV